MFIILAALFAAVLPETNDRTLLVSPLEHGEVAFAAEPTVTNSACLKIGSGNAVAMDVIDRTGIHGYSVHALDRGTYSVLHSANMTYDGVEDRWISDGVGGDSVYTLRVVCPNDVMLFDCKYDSRVEYTGIIPKGMSVLKSEVRGNIAEFEFKHDGGATMYIFGVEPQVRKIGDPDYVNNLLDKSFMLADEYGEFDLKDLRFWTTHLYDNNRGVDWSMYPAKYAVRMGKHALMLGDSSGVSPDGYIAMHAAETNRLTIGVRGRKACDIYLDGEMRTNGTERLIISACSLTSDYIMLSVSPQGFSEACTAGSFHFLVAADLNFGNSWIEADAELISESGGVFTFRVPRVGGARYCRVSYSTTSVVYEIKGTVRARGLRLLGDDGVWYRITVDNGTISATAE